MPRPLYMICASSGALDQYTNTMSLYRVIESVRLRAIQPQPGSLVILSPLSMLIVAAWVKEPQDEPEQTFEAEIGGFMPGNEGELFSTSFPPFKFETPVHRLIVPELKIPPTLPASSGLLRFESRIRRAGETEWRWRQEYVIFMEVEAASPPPAPAPPQPPSQPPTEGPTH
jgi:hypothetical protein